MCHLLPGRAKRSVLKSHFTPLVWVLVQNPKGGDMYIDTYIYIYPYVYIYTHKNVYMYKNTYTYIYM